jgi:transposase
MYVCRVADPETKGKIENLVKYVKNNFLCARDFKDVNEVNESVSRWLKRRANGKISQATKQIPAVIIEKEREKTGRDSQRGILRLSPDM